MLYVLDISNYITINNVSLKKFLKYLTLKEEHINSYTIYTIPNVEFCGIVGNLIIYIKSNIVYKLYFYNINYIQLFDILHIDAKCQRQIIYNKLNLELKDKYKYDTENNLYYNDFYNIMFIELTNSYNILIERRNKWQEN